MDHGNPVAHQPTQTIKYTQQPILKYSQQDY